MMNPLRHFLKRLPVSVDLRLLVAAAIFCFAIWCFAEIADDAPEGDYLPLETKILQSLRQQDNLQQPVGPSWLKGAALDLTALGSLAVLSLITILACGYLLLLRRFRDTAFVIAAVCCGSAITFILKSLYARPRPNVVPPLAEAATASFPSGHAMTSSIVYLTLGALLAQGVAQRREKLYFIAAALLLAFLIGLTRVYLGVHYPTDVVAGWAAGTAWALLAWSIGYWARQRHVLDRGKNMPPSHPSET